MIAGGMVEGFIGAENIKTCIKGMAIPMGDIEDAVRDFEKKKAKAVMQGLHELADALYALPDALATCNATDYDVKQIVHALAQFHKPKSFVFHLGKNLVVNRQEIYSEIFTSVSDYKAQKWSDFGVQIGLALHKLIVGADDIKTCIKGMAIPMGDIEDAVRDFEKKKAKAVMQGLHELADALYALPDALATCNATDYDVKQIVHALAQFHKPKTFVFHLGKNLVVNRHEIYSEIFASVGDFKSQKWSEFGVQIGLALHKLIVGTDENKMVADGNATPAQDAGMIAGGIVEGFIGADNVKTCVKGMAIPIGDIEDAVKDF